MVKDRGVGEDLEIDDIDLIETNESHEEANVHCGDLIR
jgi:hypothetical protein